MYFSCPNKKRYQKKLRTCSSIAVKTLKVYPVGSHTKSPNNLYPFRLFLCFLLSILCIFSENTG